MIQSKTRHYIFLIVIILTFQEFLFRWSFPLSEISNIDRTNYIDKENAINVIPRLRYKRMYYQSAPDTSAKFVHHLNNYGFRDADWLIDKRPETKRILFVGDSFTEGAMARQHMQLTDHFKNELALDQYDIMNAGIIGIGLEGYLKAINELVPTFKPDYLFLVLYSNDAPFKEVSLPDKQFTPVKSNLFIPRMITLISDLMDGIPLNFRWSPVENIMPAVPDPSNSWTHRGDEFSPHVRPDFAEHMRHGRFNSFHINWVLKEEHFLKKEVNFEPYILALQGFLKEHNTQLIICYIPSRHQVNRYYYKFSRATCRILCPGELNMTTPEYHIHRKQLNQLAGKLNFIFVDTTPVVLEAEQNNKHLYWNYDDHMRESGYRTVGLEIHSKTKHLF